MKLLCDCSLEDLKKNLVGAGLPAYAAGQIMDWVYHKHVGAWDGMTNLNAEKRQQLAQEWIFPALKLVDDVSVNNGQTIRFNWSLKKGGYVQSYLIFSEKERIVNISSQVGHPAAPFFSPFSKLEFRRNLSAGEIIEQVVHIARWLGERGEKITGVRFQCEGEPLKNYRAVLQAIRILTHPKMLAIPQQKVTISTVGITEEIRQLSHEGLKVKLTLSLHAPNQQLRKKIVPFVKKYPLEEVIAALENFAKATKQDVFYDYTLIKAMNDHPDQAFELAHLLKGKKGTVRLFLHATKSPDKKVVKDFRTVLFGAGIANKCYDIEACKNQCF